MSELKKPKPFQRKALLQYNDVIDFIEAKYKIDTRNYAGHKYDGKCQKPYLDFWHWIGDTATNGGTIYIPHPEDDEYIDEKDKWVTEILALIWKEFGEYAEGEFIEVITEW